MFPLSNKRLVSEAFLIPSPPFEPPPEGQWMWWACYFGCSSNWTVYRGCCLISWLLPFGLSHGKHVQWDPPGPGCILGSLPRRNCQQLSCAACFRQWGDRGMQSRHCSRACGGDGTGVHTEWSGTPISAHGRTPTTAGSQGLGFHVGALVSASPVA